MRTQRRNTPPIFRRSPLVMALAFALMPGVGMGATFVVTDPGDNAGIDPAAGANTGTLRQALVDSNVVDGMSNCVNTYATISFAGPFTTASPPPILVTNALPSLNCHQSIDGTGLPGRVKIDGGLKTISCGLNSYSPGSRVLGLEITGFVTGLCGTIDAYANKIHDNNTGIVAGSGTAIGDGTAAWQNFIYANGTGISINESSGILVYKNFIGSPDGVTSAGNGVGIDLQYTNSNIVSNIISGNVTGVQVRYDFGSGVSGNYIGTDGVSMAGNTIGVDIGCGGGPTLEYNTISGNASHGVVARSYANIYSNQIGTNASATGPNPNGGAGIHYFYGGCFGSGGADIYDNDIAYNDLQGVTVADSLTKGIWIEENRIYSNTGKNIDLGSNPTALPNDDDTSPAGIGNISDMDPGANNQQNYPEISAVVQVSDVTNVTYTLYSQPGSYYIEFFSNGTDGPPGGRYVDYDYITITNAGAFTSTYTLSGTYDFVSATATLDIGSPCCDTSEFSPRVKASLGPTPSAFLSPGSILDFGNTALGSTSSPQSLQVVSNGTADYMISFFADYGGSAPICFGGPFICATDCNVDTVLKTPESCTLTARFDASGLTLPSSYTQVLSLYDNTTASPKFITLKGAAVIPPPVAITPQAWDFGSVLVGKQGPPQTFSITNPGALQVNIGAVTTTGDFIVQSTDCGSSIAGGASCNTAVSFYPTMEGPAFGTLQVGGTAGGIIGLAPKVISDIAPPSGTASASLTGLGVSEARVELPASIEMGAYSLGDPPISRVVELRNSGNSFMSISMIAAGPPFSATSDCPPNLARGTACNITVRFSSTTVGNFTGTLTVVTNAAGGSAAIPIHARTTPGPQPDIHLSATNIGFGERLLGTTTASQRVTITNAGNAMATLTSVVPSNLDFVVTGTSCGATLAPALTCFADVAMRPVGFGPRTGQLLVNSNAPDSPAHVDLAGTGCRPAGVGAGRSGTRNNCAP